MDVAAPLVQASHVSVSLGRKPVPILHEICFSVHEGSLVGLLGPNGSGKTTLLRTVSGLLPYTGSLQLYSSEVSTWNTRALARRVAVVRQNTQLLFDFTVQEIVLLGLSPHKRLLEGTSRHDYARVKAALMQVDLNGYQERSILSLSGGERQRVFLAQALVQDATLLLLDEPTTHLDVHHQHRFLQQIRAHVAEGRNALAVFHDLELAARYCTHLIVLDGGRLIAEGTPADVLTEALLASVFKMRTRIRNDQGGELRVAYDLPLPDAATRTP